MIKIPYSYKVERKVKGELRKYIRRYICYCYGNLKKEKFLNNLRNNPNIIELKIGNITNVSGI